MCLISAGAAGFPEFFGLLGLTDRHLLGLCLLNLRIGAILSLAVRLVSISLVGARLAEARLWRAVAGRVRLLAQLDEQFLAIFGAADRGLLDLRLLGLRLSARPLFATGRSASMKNGVP